MRKKLCKVPLEPHIYKFVMVEETFVDGFLDMKKRHYYPRTRDWHHYKKYFANKTPRHKEILVLTMDPKREYLYALVCHWEARFAEKMMDYIDAREGLMAARAAIKDFLDKYDIDSDEYKLDTAYKRYQRDKMKKDNESTESFWR